MIIHQVSIRKAWIRELADTGAVWHDLCLCIMYVMFRAHNGTGCRSSCNPVPSARLPSEELCTSLIAFPMEFPSSCARLSCIQCFLCLFDHTNRNADLLCEDRRKSFKVLEAYILQSCSCYSLGFDLQLLSSSIQMMGFCCCLLSFCLCLCLVDKFSQYIVWLTSSRFALSVLACSR